MGGIGCTVHPAARSPSIARTPIQISEFGAPTDFSCFATVFFAIVGPFGSVDVNGTQPVPARPDRMSMKEAHSLIHYETVFLLPGDAQPQKVDDFVEKVKSLIVQKGGEVTLLEKWGRRRLAYPIGRQREGYYTFMQFNAEPSFVAELNQFFRVSEDVIRQLICKALKGKPASPMMVLPPVAPHESHGHRPSSQGAAPVAAASAAGSPAAPVSAVPEVSHADNASPRPA